MGVVLNFDATNVPTNDVREAIPTGWYNVKIVDSEMKENSGKTGAFLALTLEVIDGQYAGAKLFDNLNLQNPNPTAVEIAYKTLSSICHAVGVLQVPQSDVLHERPMQAKVALQPAVAAKAADHNGPAVKGRDASNDVKGYKAYEGPAGAAAASGPAGGTPSWMAQSAPAQQPAAAPQQQAATYPAQAAQPGTPPAWNPAAQPATPANQPAQQQAAPAWNPAAQQQAQPAPQAQQQAAPQWAQQAQPAPQAAPAAQVQHPAPGAMPPWMQNK